MHGKGNMTPPNSTTTTLPVPSSVPRPSTVRQSTKLPQANALTYCTDFDAHSQLDTLASGNCPTESSSRPSPFRRSFAQIRDNRDARGHVVTSVIADGEGLIGFDATVSAKPSLRRSKPKARSPAADTSMMISEKRSSEVHSPACWSPAPLWIPR